MKLEIVDQQKFNSFFNQVKVSDMSDQTTEKKPVGVSLPEGKKPELPKPPKQVPIAEPKEEIPKKEKPKVAEVVPKPAPFPVDAKGQKKTEPIKKTVDAISQAAPEDPDKYKFTYKKSIGTGTFLGFVVGLIYFMQTLQIIDWWKPTDIGFQIVMWIFFWTVVIIIGWEKGSLKEFMFNVIKVIYSPAMDSDSKLQFIKNMMEKLAGLAILLNEECEKKKTKLTIFGKGD